MKGCSSSTHACKDDGLILQNTSLLTVESTTVKPPSRTRALVSRQPGCAPTDASMFVAGPRRVMFVHLVSGGQQLATLVALKRGQELTILVVETQELHAFPVAVVVVHKLQSRHLRCKPRSERCVNPTTAPCLLQACRVTGRAECAVGTQCQHSRAASCALAHKKPPCSSVSIHICAYTYAHTHITSNLINLT